LKSCRKNKLFRKQHISLTITSSMARYVERESKFKGDALDLGIRAFFSTKIPKTNGFEELFPPALETLGLLKADEMYGFVPALALGGPMELKNLKKVKTIEHLTFLSQLSPLQDWGFPDA
ncbi:DUF1851 domain-containing protein, partial [Pseudomonas syringae]